MYNIEATYHTRTCTSKLIIVLLFQLFMPTYDDPAEQLDAASTALEQVDTTDLAATASAINLAISILPQYNTAGGSGTATDDDNANGTGEGGTGEGGAGEGGTGEGGTGEGGTGEGGTGEGGADADEADAAAIEEANAVGLRVVELTSLRNFLRILIVKRMNAFLILWPVIVAICITM